MKQIFFALGLLWATGAAAQTNVRAWYAKGQVWVVWEMSLPLPETYAIYGKATPFSSTNDAVLLGRLFREEYMPAALREQTDSTANFRIPDGNGGIYELSNNEALFVGTPHQASSLWIAVAPWGTTSVTPSNITPGPINVQYNPVNDPVECHLQRTFFSPFNNSFICFAYYMWADGRQNQWENRPDFPVMASQAKNGMPSMFIVSAPLGLDTTGGIPLTVWLHGGGGTARQSLPGSRVEINIKPEKGITVSHNDDFCTYLLGFYSGLEGVTRHFGWRKNLDPFTGEADLTPDTIVNYTQRRYLWIDQWLVRNFNVDPNRININGHSMGSKGSIMLAKAFPQHYATATILNNGFLEDDPPMLIDVMFGPSALNFPTNLKNRDGETVGYSYAMNLEMRLATDRDLPIIRVFNGKNDTQSGASWDSYVVNQYYFADSTGMGAQLYWSERSHGPDTGPAYNDHWLSGAQPDQQTVVDNVAYEENFRSDLSYPAFFNHHLDPKNNHPGDGTSGTGAAGVGDDWGAWGGYHRWDSETLHETEHQWAVTAWLESEAIFSHDNCPNNFLTADLAIRRPQQFKPVTGQPVYWRVLNEANGTVLQSGSTTVQPDDFVVIPQVNVFKESIGKVRIEVGDMLIGTDEVQLAEISLAPNPVGEWVLFPENVISFVLYNQQGHMVLESLCLPGKPVNVAPLPPGVYFVKALSANGRHQNARIIKL